MCRPKLLDRASASSRLVRNMRSENGDDMRHCNSKTKASAPCRAPAGPGGLCFFHANPDKAHALGQIGGRKNRSQLPEPPAHGCLNAADLRDILIEAIRDVRSKKITPRTAGALAQLANSLHRVLPTADLEARLAKLEQQLVDQQSRTSVDADPARSRRHDETSEETDAQPGDVYTKERGDGAENRNDGSGEGGEA